MGKMRNSAGSFGSMIFEGEAVSRHLQEGKRHLPPFLEENWKIWDESVAKGGRI